MLGGVRATETEPGNARSDGGPTRTRIRAARVSVGVVSLIGVLAVAASTGSVDVWLTPEATTGRAAPRPVVDDDVVASVGEPLDGGSGAVGVVVAVLLLFVVVLLLGSMLGRTQLAERLERRLGWRRLPTTLEDPLGPRMPDGADVGLDEARDALLDGDARNGIVACWMRLERDGFNAGLPRRAAETADEYSQRVVESAAVDSTPLHELAELYREARFSSHSVNEDDRVRALEALARIATHLAARATMAT